MRCPICQYQFEPQMRWLSLRQSRRVARLLSGITSGNVVKCPYCSFDAEGTPFRRFMALPGWRNILVLALSLLFILGVVWFVN